MSIIHLVQLKKNRDIINSLSLYNTRFNQLHDISKIRNFGIIAHIDAGKTTTTEKLLLLTGVIKHSGRVDEGTAYTDWLYEEKKHGITIKSAAIKCKWHTNEFNIIDTPGASLITGIRQHRNNYLWHIRHSSTNTACNCKSKRIRASRINLH